MYIKISRKLAKAYLREFRKHYGLNITHAVVAVYCVMIVKNKQVKDLTFEEYHIWTSSDVYLYRLVGENAKVEDYERVIRSLMRELKYGY